MLAIRGNYSAENPLQRALMMRSLLPVPCLWAMFRFAVFAVFTAVLSSCASHSASPDSHLPAPTAGTLGTSTPTPAERTATQRKIAALLFGIALADIDEPHIGANYDYNHFGEDPEPENTCDGYAGGHAGTDMQTKDVEGVSTADRQVFSLTGGEVVGVDVANGRVFIKTTVGMLRERELEARKTETVQLGYFHLRQIFVKPGDTTAAGTPLGIQGNLGLGLATSDTTTREHVHVEVRAGNASVGAACGAAPRDGTGSAKNGALDPQRYFEAIANSLGLRLR
jgi:murein DD-endopeptidase MepM/ murein hydrolase activator NlpD